MKSIFTGVLFFVFLAGSNCYAEDKNNDEIKVKFAYPVISVKDIQKSKDFYTKVLGIPLDRSFGDSYYIEGKIGFGKQNQLESWAFKNPEASKNSTGPERIWLYFESNDLEGIFARVEKSGVKIIHGIEEQPWGQRSFRFYDPDDHIVDISDQRALDF